MKLIATAIVTLFAVGAFANEGTATTTTTTATTTEKKVAAPAVPADAKAAAMNKMCEGKAGKELEKCQADMKKHSH